MPSGGRQRPEGTLLRSGNKRAITKDLVNVPDKEVTMITVEYAPGGADPVHRLGVGLGQI